ncbi:hypothetical protein UR09_04585, partial [Candidatus Nitromaritima sp. SCGC AAA799-A02]
GCLIGIFSQEVSESHPELRKICQKSFKGFVGELKKDLAEAKSKYAPKASFKVEDLAEYLLATCQGAMVLARANKDKGALARAVNQYKNYLKMLFGQ